jgi:LCP family protein required for cell wall assembly
MRPFSIKLRICVLAIPLLLVGCGGNNPDQGQPPVPTTTPLTKLLAADLDNLGLENVFMPVDPTPYPNGPIFPTATPDGRAPTDWESVLPETSASTNQPAAPLNLPHDQVNFLLLGSDQRPYEGGFRTDVIMLVSINTESQVVNMVSFPRDLYVYLPGLYPDRINAAMARGGFPLLADTMEYNFGVRPDYYGMINFWSFKSLIDTLGGINVQVEQTLTGERTGYGDYTVYPGSVNMDGETTLWYVRSRTYTGDFDRTRRQQEVVTALVRRVLSFDVVTKFPALFSQFQGIIETNLPLADISPFLPVADELFSGDYGTYAVDESMVSHWRTPTGSAVLLPNQEAIRNLLVTALDGN